VKLHRLVVEIYEAEIPEYPVVTHIFTGKTQKESLGYFKAHMTTDDFLRECVSSGKWKSLSCSYKARWA